MNQVVARYGAWVLLVWAVSLASGSQAQVSRRDLATAQALVRQEEYGLALPRWREIHKQNPDDPDANFQLGICLLRVGQGAQAYPYLIRARELYAEGGTPLDSTIDYLIGQSQQHAYMWDEALASYQTYYNTLSLKKEGSIMSDVEERIAQCRTGRRLMAAPTRARITNVGEPVNTRFNEYTPVITADGQTMMFTSRRDGSTGGKLTVDGLFFEDVYVTTRRGDGWAMPVNIGNEINGPSHDAAIGLSPDGNLLFLRKDLGQGDIYVASRQGRRWSKPKPISDRINTKSYDEPSCSITPDGRTLYFSSNRPGGQGGMDIWVSRRLPGSKDWSEPENLGPTINTASDEDSPFIHPDGVSLYFSSKGHETMGGYDIFRVLLQPGGEWTQPENLGYPINTGANDIYFVLTADSRTGYYASERPDGKGGLDIYRITIEAPNVEGPAEARAAALTTDTANPQGPVALRTFETKPGALEATGMAVLLVKGIVRDAATGQPLAASLQIVDNQSAEVVYEQEANTETGEYLVVLPGGKNYGLSVNAPGYLFQSENFFLPDAREYREYVKNIDMQKAAAGTRVVLRNIFFDTDKATLRPESRLELEKLLRLMKEMATLNLEISGHTDNVGSADYNKRLSLARAQAVVNYLTQNGVAPSRLRSAGYGFDRPMTSNANESGRQLNRRTEFEVQ